MGIDRGPDVGTDAVGLLSELSDVLLRTPSMTSLARAAISEVLLRQFRAEVLCYNDVSLNERTVTTPVLISSRPPLGPVSPRLESMVCDHPLISHYCETCDDEPLLITDACGRSEWERTEIATELRHQFGVHDQLAIPTAVAPGRVSAWVVMRAQPFTEHELQQAREFRRVMRGLRSVPLLSDGSPPEPPALTVGSETKLPALTKRETDVLGLLADGLTGYAIGRRLAISQHTVAKHLQHIYDKLGVHDRLAAVRLAQRHRLIPPAAEWRPADTPRSPRS